MDHFVTCCKQVYIDSFIIRVVCMDHEILKFFDLSIQANPEFVKSKKLTTDQNKQIKSQSSL